ncbi:MAG: hypothetical protein WAK48_22635 [Candidatus Acidiferrum sp.]
MKTLVMFCTVLTLAFTASTASAHVTTSQYDNLRSDATSTETVLTPQNVNAKQFGKLGAFKVDGAVYAQPLFLPSVDIPGKGTHDVLYIATEHDTVYAFDANRPMAREFSGQKARHCRSAYARRRMPEVGITSSPVIDLKTGTLYFLARTMADPSFGHKEYFQHLHALAITTGVEKFAGPQLITASVPAKAPAPPTDKSPSIRCAKIPAPPCSSWMTLSFSHGPLPAIWIPITAGSWPRSAHASAKSGVKCHARRRTRRHLGLLHRHP